MDKEQLDKLDSIIRENFLNPDDYPRAKKNSALIGSVFKSDFEDSGKWISQEGYINVIQKILKNSEDTELIVIEDFERKYKSSGKTVRLNEIVKESWADFNTFAEQTEIISFFAIGKSQDWVIWANRDYWCIKKKKTVYNSLELGITQESILTAFSEADEEFIAFIENLYS